MDKQEKIPNREWLLGWLSGYYWAMANKLGIAIETHRLNLRSRESLWKLYKKIIQTQPYVSRGSKL